MASEFTWDELYPELLGLIVRKLSYPDAVRFSAVCTIWRRVAKTSRVFSRLLLPIRKKRVGFSAILDSTSTRSVTVKGCEKRIVTSSKNMLVVQGNNEGTKIWLKTTLSGPSFRLPSLTKLDSIEKRKRNDWNGKFKVHIPKAVVLVTSEKKRKDDEPNLVVAIIYKCNSATRSIAYCHVDGLWAELEGIKHPEDIVARERRLFALSSLGSVKAWDFDQSGIEAKPVKVTSVVPSEALPWNSGIRYSINQYLVESMGEFLIVLRVSCSWFYVYKYCLVHNEKWEEVESLGDDKALFLGRNESALVSIRDLPMDCEGNSIYFADESGQWVYSLADKTVRKFCERNDEKRYFRRSVWMVKT